MVPAASTRAPRPSAASCAPLPVGLVHDDAGDIVIDPDAGVQAAIRDLFAAFTACGSAYGVVAAFRERRFPLRAYGGAWAGELHWGKLTHARVLGVLKNPCYAGPTCTAAIPPAAASISAGPCIPCWWNGPGPSGRY